MNQELVNAPSARSWRDIPQPVKARAMSRGGRWRRALSALRVAGAVAMAGGVGWGAWKVAAALGEDPKAMPAAARSVPLRVLDLKTDGALNADWLARTLAVPKNAALMELDLGVLRDRLLADGQVIAANLTRRFPDGLEVQVRERTPVARAMAEIAGGRRQLLVARDGVVFFGAGYDAALLESLPWLDGIAIARKGDRFLPVPGMDIAADLLAKTRLEAEHLYRTWGVISLARLESDGELEVRTREPFNVAIVFAANPTAGRAVRDVQFLKQIANLDLVWEKVESHPGARGRIDLSLGRQAPVMLEDPAAAPPATRPTLAPVGAKLISFSTSAQPKTQREL